MGLCMLTTTDAEPNKMTIYFEAAFFVIDGIAYGLVRLN